MRRTRVKYVVSENKKLQIGYLIKDKEYKGGFKVVSGDKNSTYAVETLDLIERI
jgi:hypothetical protein